MGFVDAYPSDSFKNYSNFSNANGISAFKG